MASASEQLRVCCCLSKVDLSLGPPWLCFSDCIPDYELSEAKRGECLVSQLQGGVDQDIHGHKEVVQYDVKK